MLYQTLEGFLNEAALKIPEKIPLDFTYETGIDEALHPDKTIIWRFVEVAMSQCKFGCKIYADPLSNVRVLAHAEVYGCRKRKDDIVVELV